jgi:hypothetical protein
MPMKKFGDTIGNRTRDLPLWALRQRVPPSTTSTPSFVKEIRGASLEVGILSVPIRVSL